MWGTWAEETRAGAGRMHDHVALCKAGGQQPPRLACSLASSTVRGRVQTNMGKERAWERTAKSGTKGLWEYPSHVRSGPTARPG